VASATVLVIHPGALGDVLLGIPALRSLRARHPGTRLALAAQPHLGRMLVALGEADQASAFESLGLESLFVDDGGPAAAPAIRDAACVVCWFGSGDPTFTRRLRALAPSAVVASAAGDGTCAVWQHLAATVGSEEPAAREPAVVSRDFAAEGRDALSEAGWDGHTPVLVVHVGAGGLAKRWPVEGFAQVIAAVARRHDVAVAIHEGPADAGAVATLAGRVDGAFVLKRLELPRLAGALRHTAAWLGNDSGVTHLAAAVGVPTVALFSAENVAWRSWSPTSHVVVIDPTRVTTEHVAAVTAALHDRLGR